MGAEIKIVEVDIVEGKAFVTFSDGKVALLAAGQLHAFAVDSASLTTIPLEEGGRDPHR